MIVTGKFHLLHGCSLLPDFLVKETSCRRFGITPQHTSLQLHLHIHCHIPIKVQTVVDGNSKKYYQTTHGTARIFLKKCFKNCCPYIRLLKKSLQVVKKKLLVVCKEYNCIFLQFGV